MSANWIRREFRRLTYTKNLAVPLASYTRIDIPNPLNPSELIPVYSQDRATLGRINQLDRNSPNNERWNNGFDVDINARVGGGSVFAGMSWDQQIRVECDVQNPNELRFCDQSAFGMPFRTMFKMAGTYPLPLGVEVSGSFQSYAGGSQAIDNDEAWQDVEYVVDRIILPSLVQSLVTVPLIQPGTKYLPRMNQLDVRFGKVFEIGRLRARGQFDIFNATNSSSILAMGETFGPGLDQVNQILPGRVYGLSMRVDF
jgi:hypothetical protein